MKFFLEIHTVKITIPKDEQWTFVCEPLGDVHYGAKNFDEAEFKRHVDRIRKEKRYTILMGDLCDSIFPVPGEKRFDPDTVDPRIFSDREYGVTMAEREYTGFYDLVKPIKDQILCVLTGNHDDITRTKLGYDFIHDLCKPEKLNNKYMGFGGFVRLYFVEKGSSVPVAQLTIRAIHGAYTGMQIGGAINRLEQAAKFWDADVLLVGHNHQVGGSVQEALTLTNTFPPKLLERKRIFANTGSFYRGFTQGTSSYVELKDKPPTRIGTITFEFAPRTGQLYLHQ